MKTNQSISVGIPAFNEEANIYYLLKDILSQQLNGINLDKIVVSSDGSTDNTVAQIKRIKSKRIVLLNHKKRLGRTFRQEEIMRKVKSDALVLIDADTLIRDKNFLQKIVTPIFKGKADLTSVRVEELQPENFIEKILETSMKLKKYIFESINQGNNLYTCHGRARAFSKRLYRIIKFKNSISEDAYSYLFSISKGMSYQFVGDTEIFYKLPVNFRDHKKQSVRFIKSKKDLAKEFGEEMVTKNYSLPFMTVLPAVIKFAIRKPLMIIAYILTFGLIKITSIFSKTKITWDMSSSSKKLRKGII